MKKRENTPFLYGREDVKLLNQRDLYKGFFRMTEYRFKHRLFEGGWSEEVKREVFERGNAGVLLAYDPKRDEVVLIEQIRIPAYETSETPWLLEVVAGMVEEGESPEDVVRREAQEEAGVVVGRCEPIVSYLSSPGGTSERMHVYVGEVDATTAKGIHGLACENEDIRVHVVSREQAYRWVEEGVIDNAASVIALQWLQLHHIALRERWSVI
ncbi:MULTISPECIES: ADP-ribose diphosphatase [Proteus]|uniref:ADP-ribose pyrophosphatase n=1 Tax=Proteus terrae subsp. cibarius TaxID=626774 RepID=A0A6I6G468_9GAMM|nr:MULTISPECIES: ADP-ribose diphosphatase [Proteus]ATM99540.1 ADP-ribose diphosphatase [Proteus vulgaris]MBG2838519.1 ADP-ribose diphosphatase [Proteus terrae subsp. cibarius]MBG2869383.1 ADP-ribose diphosphatase [Proteus terrae subsp. cibarius]MBG2914449.1 ADP-ribose diphosphatase [Proteus terrae subsp. cibarius]MBG6038436.1 ADP-ribose diphosphatase [Proteus terrae subsp. cibarius]